MIVGAAAIAARGRGDVIPDDPSIPTDNLIVWVEGDDGITDKSGNTDPITTTGISIISSDLNGHDVFEFADYSGYMRGNTLTTSNPTDLYIVAVTRTLDTQESVVYAHRDSSTELIQARHSSGSTSTTLVVRSNSSTLDTTNATDTTGTYGKRVWDFSKTAQEVTTPSASNSSSNNYTGETFNSDKYTIGGFDSTGSSQGASHMRLALLVAYSVKPTAQEISDIDTYISNTYGV